MNSITQIYFFFTDRRTEGVRDGPTSLLIEAPSRELKNVFELYSSRLTTFVLVVDLFLAHLILSRMGVGVGGWKI